MHPARPLSSGFFFAVISMLLLSGGQALSANQEVITDDGREVLLREDGSWEFRSDDRFANTSDGQRVRLKADGSWEYLGNAPLVTATRVRTDELDIRLQNVVIEKQETKVQKNVRVKTQTVFDVTIELSPLAESEIMINDNDASLIEVKDNRGRDYPVISIGPDPVTLSPGGNLALAVRVDGSPQWWKNVKTIAITFRPGILGLQRPTTFSWSVDSIDKKSVEGFDALQR
ncbi:MAG: hypothetical protein JSW45_00265 [Thiotrichales bacterium]|nr:MAG: hypothetical protein JSW45_00265 [Thiotrichales bacterium]